jgi:F-type H+-transporting ATPase subunit epsilon
MQTTSGKQLLCVVVTPEKAVLEEPADFVALPMFDGELGVLPGRAPLIGRLGPGELRLTQHGTDRRLFVDGGFAQVRSDVVTVLTARAVPAGDISEQAAQQELTAAQAVVPKSAEEQDARQKAEDRARAMLRVARHGSGAAAPAGH